MPKERISDTIFRVRAIKTRKKFGLDWMPKEISRKTAEILISEISLGIQSIVLQKKGH